MATLTDYKGLDVVEGATGAGGIALTENFKELADWQPKSVWTQSADPGPNDDQTQNFYPGSQWLRTDLTPPRLFLCRTSSPGAAQWNRVSLNPVALTSDVTGVLPMANGGTGGNAAGTAATNLGLGSSSNVSHASLALSGHLSAGGGTWRFLTESRTLPVTVNDVVSLGSMTMTSGAGQFRISLVVTALGIAQAKCYLVSTTYNRTANVWEMLQPLSDTGLYSGQGCELDINVNNSVASFRVRRTAGTTAGTAWIALESVGSTEGSWSPSSTTDTVTPPTTLYNSTVLRQVNGRVGAGVADPKAVLHAATSTILGVAGAANANGDLGNNQVNLWVDEANDRLMFKVKYSNGTVKSGSVALS